MVNILKTGIIVGVSSIWLTMVSITTTITTIKTVHCFQPLSQQLQQQQQQPHYLSMYKTPTTKSIQTMTQLTASTMDDTQQEKEQQVLKNPIKSNNDIGNEKAKSMQERFASTSMASAAAVAAAAVNAAVAMKTLQAPDVQKSYVVMDRTATEIDEDGLPLTYDKEAIEAYWSRERGALNKRWGQFVGKAVPFFTRLTTLWIRDGTIREEEIPALSRQARLDLQDLGATFIKAGQMMSVRPDVLPASTLLELEKLQASVEPFATEIAVQQIERELKGPLGQFFTSISEEPVAAASLAQVYKATLNDGKNTTVAIKVQRPDVLGTVSKDLYVLRRAAEVVNSLVQRFAPQQRTDYVALMSEWALGFYTELDFKNEALNQRRLREMLLERNVTAVTVPKVYDELCTRRILVSQWIDGKKLSECTNEKIAEVTPATQEAFLLQLFELGFFHADPHPGNLLIPSNPDAVDGAQIVLIDCGLMASIDEVDRDNMISAVIHLANKNYAALVDDFIRLNILPPDSNRATIVPLMDKALTPYVKGGGAKKYEEELMKIYGVDDTVQSKVGGFQSMTQDALTVLQDVPFSIPPYFAILGRAIITLEGVALKGNPDYGIIMEAYPFIARKLLREGRPEIQKALQEVLYSSSQDNTGSGLKLNRLLALLNNAAGAIATQEGAAFVDLDTVPEDSLDVKDGLKFILSDNAESLRNLLEKEVDNVVDVLSRQLFRQAVSEAVIALTPPRPPALPFLGDVFPPTPAFDEIPLPLLLPGLGPEGRSRPSVSVLSLKEFTNLVAPELNQDEEIFALGLADGAREFFGDEIGDLIVGERVISPQTIYLVVKALQSGVLGRNDLMETNAVKSILQFVKTAMNSARRNSSSLSSTELETNLFQAINNLNEKEKARFDTIVEELVQRATNRAIVRLAMVNRIL